MTIPTHPGHPSLMTSTFVLLSKRLMATLVSWVVLVLGTLGLRMVFPFLVPCGLMKLILPVYERVVASKLSFCTKWVSTVVVVVVVVVDKTETERRHVVLSKVLDEFLILALDNFDSRDQSLMPLSSLFLPLDSPGHVLGIGTLWSRLGVPRSGCSSTSYTGAAANREYQQLSGCSTSIPIETDGSPGTACGHFDEACFGVSEDSVVLSVVVYSLLPTFFVRVADLPVYFGLGFIVFGSSLMSSLSFVSP